jgi:fimbrial chaperone protein
VLAPVRATAADLQVSPVRVILDPQQSSAVMTLTNRGATDSLLQLSVMSWTQGPGGEILTPTRDILANPGVFLLKAGEQQIARFALRVTPDAKERSYRIVLQEVPRQRVENGLATVLRLLVPVFVPPPNPTASLEWSARVVPGGLEIGARNTGTVHVQIKAVKLSGDRVAPVSTMSNIYVLPGSTRTLHVPVASAVKAGAVLQIAAETDQQSFNARVVAGAAEGVPAQP